MPRLPASSTHRLITLGLVTLLGALRLPAQSHVYLDGETYSGALTGPATLNVESGSATQTGALQGGGFTKTGAGTLTFDRNFAYVEDLFVTNGTLTTAASLGADYGQVYVSGNQSVLETSRGVTIIATLLIADNGGTLDFTNYRGGQMVITSAVYLGNDSTLKIDSRTVAFSAPTLFVQGSNNQITLGGQAAQYVIGDSIEIYGTGNTLTIQGGADVPTTYASISMGNHVTVTGSYWSMPGDLNLGVEDLPSAGSATLTVEAGSILGAGNLLLGYGTAGHGTLNIGAYDLAHPTAAGTVNAPISFGGSGGQINFNQTGTTTFAATIGGAGQIVQRGTGTTTLSGTNAYTGGTAVSAGTLIAGNASAFGTGTVRIDAGTLDLGGYAISNPLDVRGGALTGLANYTGTQTVRSATGYSGNVGGDLVVATGGSVNTTGAIFTGHLTVQSGGTLSGTGAVNFATIGSGGILAPGNSPGTLNAGDTTFEGGGAFQFEVNNATGAAGTNWDQLAITGSLSLTATSANPFALEVVSLTLAHTAGSAANFDSAADYAFTFVTTTTGITGFAANKFSIDTTGFTNPFNGSWAVALANGGNALALTYTAAAIPEPSTYAVLSGLAALILASIRRRK